MTSRLIQILLSSLFVAVFSIATAGEVGDDEPAYKILYIMSYHSPWRWTDGQLEGFKEGLGDLPAEFKVFQMDTKRNSTPAQIDRVAREAKEIIEQWKPDLVFTSDDDVQEHVVRDYINTGIPFVFSGVNKPPSTYGFEGSKNVTGVLEHEHFVESVKLLQAIVPDVKKLAVVFDDAPMWLQVQQRMRERQQHIPGLEFTYWDTIRTFEEYKQRVGEYQDNADAIALIGIFNFKDRDGANVPYQEVLRWTAENSQLPDFSYWIDRVHYGTLVSVTVSEREQGLAAGRMARAILHDGQSPASIRVTPTTKGLPVISLARAKKLGIKVKSGLLLSAEVIRKFEWEE